MGWCLLLTLSRGSWVGLAASMAFIATLKYRRMWLLIFVVAAGVFVLPEAEAYVAHLLSGIQMQDKAAAMRLGEYTDALKLIARYPLLGIGFGSSPTIDLYLGVSNVYLLIAEETGLLGLGAYLLTLATLFQQGMRRLVSLPRSPASGHVGGSAGGPGGGLHGGHSGSLLLQPGVSAHGCPVLDAGGTGDGGRASAG